MTVDTVYRIALVVGGTGVLVLVLPWTAVVGVFAIAWGFSEC